MNTPDKYFRFSGASTDLTLEFERVAVLSFSNKSIERYNQLHKPDNFFSPFCGRRYLSAILIYAFTDIKYCKTHGDCNKQ